MKLSRSKVFMVFFLAVLLSAPVWASPSTANTALPGTLNYVEGQAAVGGQTVNGKSIGQVTLQKGEALSTDTGKAEILLTPGVFLRLGDHSSATMLSPSLTDTEVAVKGRAMVEVAEIYPENNLRVIEGNVPTQIEKAGLYDFDADHGQVRVFKGKAVVFDGDHEIKVDGGHALDLNTSGKLKTRKFDKKESEQSDLYRWSSLRSSYLAEANVQTARVYVDSGWYGPGWFGGGWYWSPWFGAYTFIPADGFLYSPFGWGFYSPLVAYRSPALWGRGIYFHNFSPAYRPGVVHGPAVTAHSGFSGFHGGNMGFHGGAGFHGGGMHR
jgi:hypothetical protein